MHYKSFIRTDEEEGPLKLLPSLSHFTTTRVKHFSSSTFYPCLSTPRGLGGGSGPTDYYRP